MFLKSITIRGFKSFPDRTRLEFGEGVSVVVGPNGSGKSNITDAVLWALGEQSPSAVRGQTMADVIFAGGHGVQARAEAEVELVLDNRDGLIELPASELSIRRRLNRAGEGEYRLNGARCRLADILETLAETGLGKEAHSVISQGRVEAIVTSKARDRRLLIEEAAGLGKHRKRRRRAALKLERTEENLARVLDVEREARTRLRPLKRQAEAADLHERLERQTLELRWTLARDDLRSHAVRTEEAEQAAQAARSTRETLDRELELLAARRDEAERALEARSTRHELGTRRAFGARSAHERVVLRLEHARTVGDAILRRSVGREVELAALRAELTAPASSSAPRIVELEAALARLDQERAARVQRELESLLAQRELLHATVERLDLERQARRSARDGAEQRLAALRSQLLACEQDVERARRDCASVGAELAGANQFLRSHEARAERPPIGSRIDVARGYELALAAALGDRLNAAVAADRADAERVIERARGEDARVLVPLDAPAAPPPPVEGAVALASLVTGDADVTAVLARLLADTWVLDDLSALPATFAGIAVTRAGRVWSAREGELRQSTPGGVERVLEVRNERDALLSRAQAAAVDEQHALATLTRMEEAQREALATRESAASALRDAERAHAEAIEQRRNADTLIEQRRVAPEHGEAAVARAQLEGELAAERRAFARAELERTAREHRVALLAAQATRDRELTPSLERLTAVLEQLAGLLSERLEALEAQLTMERRAGEELTGALRACAAEEAQLHVRLRGVVDALTAAEVAAQQVRDEAARLQRLLVELSERLGLAAEPADGALEERERSEIAERLVRLERRREQLGPVNPLAAQEYREALEHVEELEAQRIDLESALHELRTLIRDTDRQINASFEETFERAAANFTELVQDVFPGGRGRLRLVREAAAGGPRPAPEGENEHAAELEGEREEAQREGRAEEEDELGVEIEISPAGKAMKRLSLLSGGEKSMTAIAFLFAVFLAHPCPFYILDEVEAALDDVNIDRFLTLLRRHCARAQFIVVTHQRRTMEAADWLYGVSMGGDGVSKVISRRLPAARERDDAPPASGETDPRVTLAAADAA